MTRSATGSRIGLGLVVDVGVLEPRIRKGLDQLRVELWVGVDVHRGSLVLALQVQGVHRAGLDELGDQLVVPVVGRVELEAQAGIDGEALANWIDRRGIRLLALGGNRRQPHRDDERDGPRLTTQVLVQGGAGLAQRQVERGALERPATVVDRDLALGRLGKDALCFERLREGVDRVVAGEVEHRARVLERDVVERVVDDVLADPLVSAALQVDDRGKPVEARGLELEALELVALDRQRQIGDPARTCSRTGP